MKTTPIKPVDATALDLQRFALAVLETICDSQNVGHNHAQHPFVERERSFDEIVRLANNLLKLNPENGLLSRTASVEDAALVHECAEVRESAESEARRGEVNEWGNPRNPSRIVFRNGFYWVLGLAFTSEAYNSGAWLATHDRGYASLQDALDHAACRRAARDLNTVSVALDDVLSGVNATPLASRKQRAV